MNAPATPIEADRLAAGATGRDLEVRRVRFATRFRLLEVRRVLAIDPDFVRITLAGDELAGFESASFDDHIKVFFPAPGEDRPARPQAGPDGPVFAPGVPRPVARDFTPRRFDAAAGELDLEFALHPSGPASDWARQARPGQQLGIGGPRGSMVIPAGFDWHLLIGDETALPAIGRRLEELPATTQALVVIETAGAADRVPLASPAAHRIIRCRRDPAQERGTVLLGALEGLALPAGEGFAWAAGEHAVIRAVRGHLRGTRGLAAARIRAAAYWREGAQATHERFED